MLQSALLFSTTSTATYSHSLVALTGEATEIAQEDDFNVLLEDKPLVMDVANNNFSIQRNGATINHDLKLDDTVEFVAVSGSLPTGISVSTVYHVVSDLTLTTFRVASSPKEALQLRCGSASGTYAVSGFKLLGEQRYYNPTELANGGIVHPYAPFEKLGLGDVYRVVTRFKSPDGGTHCWQHHCINGST